MKSNLKGKVLHRLAVACICTVALVACGGGGGGGPSGIQYTGSISQAVIDDANAAALAGGSFVIGDAGASTQTGVLGTAVSDSGSTSQHSIKVADILRNAVSKIDLSASSSTAIGVTQSETVPGPCGGSITFTINVNESNGVFSGSLTFNSYCEQFGESISGQVSFSGQIDLNTAQFISLSFTVTNLTVADNGDNFIVAGTVTFSFSGSTVNLTETFNIQDGSGKIYRIENFFVSATDNFTEVQETLSGRFYHPDFGFVDVVTTTPFVIPAGSVFPTSGSLTVTGAAGGKIVLTVLDGTKFQLDIDKDGDTVFETNVVVNWTDL